MSTIITSIVMALSRNSIDDFTQSGIITILILVGDLEKNSGAYFAIRTCTIKLNYGQNHCSSIISWSVCHCHSVPPKAKSLPISWSTVRGSTLVGSSLACKHYSSVKMNESGNNSGLLKYSSCWVPIIGVKFN
jgi:hypothetical protein